MRLMHLVSLLRSRGEISRQAVELVRISQSDISASIGATAKGMGIAEARGYVRARARKALEMNLAELAPYSQRMQLTGAREAVLEEALERTIMAVVAEIVKTAPAKTIRRAA